MIWIVGPLSEALNFGQRPFLLNKLTSPSPHGRGEGAVSQWGEGGKNDLTESIIT